jgi:hypothetical protein
LTDADVAEFHADPALRESLGRSFTRFLAFLGLVLEEGRVVPGPDHAAKGEVWRVPNHNWLRITRVLASTRMLGLEAESSAFFGYLEGVARAENPAIDANTFAFWANTQRI